MVSKRQADLQKEAWKQKAGAWKVCRSMYLSDVAAGRTGALRKVATVCGGGRDKSTCNVFEGGNKGKCCLPPNVDVLIV
jgi:hypothetical protein